VIPIPPEIWPSPGNPAHPIVIPPETPPPDEPLIEWHTGWTEDTGWVIVGVPTVPAPTPSAAKKK
jgi:hypothetical protein